MSWLPSTWRAAFVSSAWLAFVGCAGALDHPERFADLGQGPDAGPVNPPPDGGCEPLVTIFPLSCSTSSCHSAQSQQGSLDLESPGLPKRLVGTTAHGGPGLLIDPQNPAQSVLLLKLTSDPPFQFQMPLGAPELSPDEVTCLKAWVYGAVTP